MRRPLHSFHVLLTVGPTREPIDPVRYLSNASSGEMGLTLASALASAGARVSVVAGPVSRPAPRGIDVVPVLTARQMSREVRRRLVRCDAFIATAAVSDWRAAPVRRTKMKKSRATALTLRLVRNPDILADAGRWKGTRARPLLVGFALETKNLEGYARRKLREKNLDLVIGNSPDSFGSASIRPLWLEKGGVSRRLPRLTKKALSSHVVRWLSRRLTEDPDE